MKPEMCNAQNNNWHQQKGIKFQFLILIKVNKLAYMISKLFRQVW